MNKMRFWNNKILIKITEIKWLLLYLLLMSVISFSSEIKDSQIILDNTSSFATIYSFVTNFISTFLWTCYDNFTIIIIFVVMRTGTKKFRKEIITKNEFEKNRLYYRSILTGYSPAVLSYVYNLYLEFDSSYTATLMGLKLKNKIDIKENNIIKLSNDTEDLEKNESYIMNADNFLNQEFEKLVIEDALDKQLIERYDFKVSERFEKNVSIIVSFLALFPTIIIIFLSFDRVTPMTIIIAILISVLVFGSFYSMIRGLFSITTRKVQKSTNFYTRTKKSKDIYKKLIGLKNYITDFSILDEREIKELILWEDYLIYSVIFNQNNDIVAEYSKYKIK